MAVHLIEEDMATTSEDEFKALVFIWKHLIEFYLGLEQMEELIWKRGVISSSPLSLLISSTGDQPNNVPSSEVSITVGNSVTGHPLESYSVTTVDDECNSILKAPVLASMS